MTDKFQDYPGTPLRESDFSEGKILYRHDEMKANFAWDTGIGIGTYLAGLKEGTLLGSHCRKCRRTVVPPRTVCEWCFRPMDAYVPLQDTGTVNTFSLCYVTWDVKRIEEPEIPAVIEIDGASPTHGIMHKLGEADPEEVHIGMRVQAVWKAPEEREGAITDILYFKPVKEGKK
jgi:uncharacterized OB-fold protein